ncbi:MAG: ribonuclease [Thermoleophilia bacterium]|nr:ribonuclease [Thermoleophilia bacterium]
MDLDVVFLGTAASVPSATRGLSSVLIRRGGERILVDCGEGTQRQLMRSVGLAEVDLVFITHLHADHVLGLPGMLKTFGMRDRERPLRIVGPPGIERFMRDMGRVIGGLKYDLDVLELRSGPVWQGDDYVIEAVRTQHGTPSIGLLLDEDDRPGRFDIDAALALGVRPNSPDLGVLQRGGEVTTDDGRTVRAEEVVGEHRSGRRLVYTGDTVPCESVLEAAWDATLLVHEATFLHEDAERARTTGHSTARGAAALAAEARVGMLALTHVSTRYAPRQLLEEAQAGYADAIVARDFDLVELPYPERGEPRHVPRGGRPRREAVGAGWAGEQAVEEPG